MAQPTNLTSTYDLSNVGKEDVGDFISIIDPTDTPFQSRQRASGLVTTATNITHEFLTDTLAAVSASDQNLEGDDANFTAATTPARLTNICEIRQKAAVVSGSQGKRANYGIENTLEYQISKRIMEIGRNFEASAFANNAKVNTNESTVREMAGIPVWLITNTDFASDGADATGLGADARTDGTVTGRYLTESMWQAVLTSAFTQGGDPDVAYCPPFQKRAIDTFQGVVLATRDVGSATMNTVINSVDIYHDAFATLALVPHRHMRSRDLIILQSDFWRWSDFRPLDVEYLAKTGDNEKAMVVMEATIESRHEKSSAGVFDLASS